MSFSKHQVQKTVSVHVAKCDVCEQVIDANNPGFVIDEYATPSLGHDGYRRDVVNTLGVIGFRFGDVEHVCLECLRFAYNGRSPKAAALKFLSTKKPADSFDSAAEDKFTKGLMTEAEAKDFAAAERAKPKEIVFPVDANGTEV